MFFGLLNILTSFQDYNDQILTQKLDIFIIVYINEILIYMNNGSLGHMTNI